MAFRVPGTGLVRFGFSVVVGSWLVGCSVASGPSSPTGTMGAATGPSGATTLVGTPARLIRLADGDSGWFEIGGQEVEVRLLGYNAPEISEGRGGPPSCNGRAAEQALADLIDGAETLAVTGAETDRYGRRLVDLVVDGRSAVDRMVADGRGLAIGSDGPERRDLMRQAAAGGRGLWGDGCGDPAAEGLEVADVEPDPPGRDEDHLNSEYVELVNRGAAPIDLAGWDIRDDSSSHRFDLDRAGVLAPGDRLVVHTGAGAPSPGRLYLDAGTPVWSNRADTVLVIDPDGVVAAWAFVG